MSGCRSDSNQVEETPEATPEVETDPVDPFAIGVRNATLEAIDDEGEPIWTVQLSESVVRLAEDQESMVFGGEVAGELFQEGEVRSTFRSSDGKADQNRGRLVLEGEVTVTEETGGGQLRADKIEYEKGVEIVKSEGNVIVDFGTSVFGPFDELWATPDLRLRGTPEEFLKWHSDS